MASFVGLPYSRKVYKFYLLEPPASIPDVSIFSVEKVVLKDRFRSNSMDNLTAATDEVPTAHASNNLTELYSVIRRRAQTTNNHQTASYSITTTLIDDHDKKIEVKRRISKDMYNILARSKDPNRDVIRQKRYCFVWEKQSFNIDEYIFPRPGLFILRVNGNGNGAPITPPFLKIGSECTDISAYQLSLKGSRNPLDSFNN